MKLTRTLSTLSAAVLVFTLVACSETDDKPVDMKKDPLMSHKADDKPKHIVKPKTAQQEKISPSKSVEKVTRTGTIVFKEMEGGFYAFVAENGDRYTLQNLDKKFHRNGLIVKVTGMPKPDLMTTTQYGTVMQVEKIEILDASRVTGNESSH